MDRKYNLRLDLQFRCNNSVMKFRQSDNNTSDFFMRVTSGGELFNIENAIVILATIKPNQDVQCQFLEIKEGKIYADLNANMKDQVGTYKAQALLIYEDERVSTDVIEYEVTEDSILNQLETTVSATEDFTLLQQMLSRLSVVENSENLRVENENNRVEAEKLREEAIEKIKLDITELIEDTNLKITNNLKSNSDKVDNLVLDSKKEIADYKNEKDIAINEDLRQYKEATTQSIEEYKSAKDTEINNSLNEYKTNTTDGIEEFKNTKIQELDDFKNTKDTEIDDYKKEKDLAINQYVENKNLALNEYATEKNSEIDRYKEAKDKEIDLYKENKDTLIDNKITEFEEAKQNIVSTANNKIVELDQAKTDMKNDVNSKIEEADNRISELQNFESQLEQIENKNIEQDNRLKEVEYKNKVQNVYVQGLFNENNDKRLTLEGEGNSLKLEGSKKGLVEVGSIVGDTLVNIKSRGEKVTTQPFIKYITLNIQQNEDYTLKIINNLGYAYAVFNADATKSIIGYSKNNVITFNSSTNSTIRIYCRILNADGSLSEKGTIEDGWDELILLEGDYTSKPIPSEYFEGMQSTFEDCKVTQEMVDSGEELEENLGKYKCEVEVRGKNLYSQEFIDALCNLNNWVGIGSYRYNFKAYEILGLKPNTKYRCTIPTLNVPAQFYPIITVCSSSTDIVSGSIIPSGPYRNDTDSDLTISSRNVITDTNNTTDSIRAYVNAWDENNMIKLRKVLENNLQLEEGTQATPYEPYYERTQTVYLNSPLLKGDEIVCKEEGLYHYHNTEEFIYDGSSDEVIDFYAPTLAIMFRGLTYIKNYCSNVNLVEATWEGINIFAYRVPVNSGVTSLSEARKYLQANPVRIVRKRLGADEPYYEKISDDKLILEIPNNATLSVESVIPCQSISASYTGNIPSVYALEETNANQDNLIDISLMATDEMYMMLEPILEAMPQTIKNERMVSKMVDMYVAMVIRGLKTIDEVPARYRKEVQSILDKLEK